MRSSFANSSRVTCPNFADAVSAPAFEGFVLAGGRSIRMGRDKAFVEVGGRRLVDRWTSALGAVGATTTTVLHRDAETRIGEADVRVVTDRHGGQGPLDGLSTALGLCTTDVAVVVAVDLVAVSSELDEATVVRRLLEKHSLDDRDATAVRLDGRLQLLLASWSVSTARAIVESAFERGVRAVHDLVPLLRIATIDLPTSSVRNVNRPDDLVG